MNTPGSPARAARRAVVVGLVATALAGCRFDRSSPTAGRTTQPTNPLTQDSVFPHPDRALATRELLPYGATYSFDQGSKRVNTTLERLRGPLVDLPTGRVGVTDPGYLPPGETPPTVGLAPGTYPTELAVLGFHDQGTTTYRGCVAVLGDPGQGLVWRTLRDDVGEVVYLGVDDGMGCLFHAADLAALTDAVEPYDALVARILDSPLAGIRIDGRTAAVVFDCGMGDGGYPTYVGYDHGGEAVAVAVDLELHHRGVRS